MSLRAASLSFCDRASQRTSIEVRLVSRRARSRHNMFTLAASTRISAFEWEHKDDTSSPEENKQYIT